MSNRLGIAFIEDTAVEIQARAREYLEKIEAELEAKRKALGVADELLEVPGITTAMLVTLLARTPSKRSRIWPIAPPTIWPAGASATTGKEPSARYLALRPDNQVEVWRPASRPAGSPGPPRP